MAALYFQEMFFAQSASRTRLLSSVVFNEKSEFRSCISLVWLSLFVRGRWRFKSTIFWHGVHMFWAKRMYVLGLSLALLLVRRCVTLMCASCSVIGCSSRRHVFNRNSTACKQSSFRSTLTVLDFVPFLPITIEFNGFRELICFSRFCFCLWLTRLTDSFVCVYFFLSFFSQPVWLSIDLWMSCLLFGRCCIGIWLPSVFLLLQSMILHLDLCWLLDFW